MTASTSGTSSLQISCFARRHKARASRLTLAQAAPPPGPLRPSFAEQVLLDQIPIFAVTALDLRFCYEVSLSG